MDVQKPVRVFADDSEMGGRPLPATIDGASRSTVIDKGTSMGIEFDAAFPTGPKSVTLTLPENVALSAEDLSAFIDALGTLRMGMLPPIASDPGTKMTVQADARIGVIGNPLRGGVVLGIRHAGLGWVYGDLPPARASEIARQISERSLASPAPKERPRGHD